VIVGERHDEKVHFEVRQRRVRGAEQRHERRNLVHLVDGERVDEHGIAGRDDRQRSAAARRQ
jgi:hypothetical protein